MLSKLRGGYIRVGRLVFCGDTIWRQSRKEAWGFCVWGELGNSGTGGWGRRVEGIDGRGGHVTGDGDLTFQRLEGDAVAAHDVAGGAGLELAGGVAEFVEDFLDQLGGAGAGGTDLLDEGLEFAVGGDDFLGLAGRGGEGLLEFGSAGILHGGVSGGDGGGIPGDELAGEGAAVFATGNEGDIAVMVDLMEVEGGDGVFPPEGAAGEGDDVVADVGFQIGLSELGLAGFPGDMAFMDGAAGDEGGVSGEDGSIFLAIAYEGGDFRDKGGGEVAGAGGSAIARSGGEGGGEEVDLSGIGLGRADAWHGGGVVWVVGWRFLRRWIH